MHGEQAVCVKDRLFDSWLRLECEEARKPKLSAVLRQEAGKTVQKCRVLLGDMKSSGHRVYVVHGEQAVCVKDRLCDRWMGLELKKRENIKGAQCSMRKLAKLSEYVEYCQGT